jgi:hypothetical protein
VAEVEQVQLTAQLQLVVLVEVEIPSMDLLVRMELLTPVEELEVQEQAPQQVAQVVLEL